MNFVGKSSALIFFEEYIIEIFFYFNPCSRFSKFIIFYIIDLRLLDFDWGKSLKGVSL